jgi:YfiH family protein
MQFETFAPLEKLDFIQHAFTLRTDDDTRTGEFENRLGRQFGFGGFASAEQTHGNGVAAVTEAGCVAGVDALMTTQRGLPLVIRCADCAPIFIVDRRTPAIALVHSGKKGTQANVIGNTLAILRHSGAQALDCLAVIGPSIGPCHYEVDLWSAIEDQLAGTAEVQNPRICTACHLDRYFSYRAERGKTGRMFALLVLR